ncbi:MAG: RHS repeat-associated core domain-containing protein [Chitinophagaceae bacterium]|nr:MAG: RHS repeat-associated core domain-containing protein [Chitinophagaceae bacterium]
MFFDNLVIHHNKGHLLEEDQYYPFGLKMAGISDQALPVVPNNYLYNGKELQQGEFSDGTGLEDYDYGFRGYDPQLGRFTEQDPLTDEFATVSPYQYGLNDPVGNIDEDGLAGLPVVTITAQAVDRMSAFSSFTSSILGEASLASKIINFSSLGAHVLQTGGILGLNWLTRSVGTKAANNIGSGPEDWYKNNKTNQISWINGSGARAGYTDLGKTLTFKFVSYIDKELWDGPNPFGLDVTGIKLTSIIYVTGHEDAIGRLTGISAGARIQLGPTPMGNARGYYPGLGSEQNKWRLTSSSSGINLNFEQHASVSPIEELGLHVMGYNIVDVAQKLNINYLHGNLSVSPSTDLFPSATLSLNGNPIMQYNQPSFRSNFRLPVYFTESPYPYELTLPSYDYSYKPAIWYKR